MEHQAACKWPDKLGVKIEAIVGLFPTARVGHYHVASVLSFACPKEKGSLSGGTNDLRGLRCF
jgi:hypothetical protein